MEPFSHGRIRIEDRSIQNTEEAVAEDEGQEVVPDELEDAALPNGHQLDEALKPLRRVVVPVGVNVAQHGERVLLTLTSDCSRLAIGDFT